MNCRYCRQGPCNYGCVDAAYARRHQDTNHVAPPAKDPNAELPEWAAVLLVSLALAVCAFFLLIAATGMIR